MRRFAVWALNSVLAITVLAFTGCSDSPSDSDNGAPLAGASGTGSGATAGTGATVGSGGSSSGGSGGNGTGGSSAGGSGTGGSGTGGSSVGGSGAGGGARGGTGGSGIGGSGTGGSGTGGASGAGAGGSGGTAGSPPNGPADGDPSKPMVSIPGVPCGVPMVSYSRLPPTVKIGGRDVVVTYPCAHEGAQVTFLFTLHGTLQDAQKIPFTMTSGPFYRLTDSHNIIYVLPKAIGTQWGRSDNGQDLPHLYEVVDWVYTTFGQKFNIRSMWAQGGSWGAAYLSSTFACDAKFESRLKGVRMVVGGGCPRCSDRLACIVAQQELEIGGGMQMTPDARNAAADRANIATFATGHGCKAKMGPTDVGNTKYWSWPDCRPGFVHSYYLAPGQHADPWDPVAIEKTTQEMKSIE
jgi:hypothetical protein